MSVRKFTREAERLEREAAELGANISRAASEEGTGAAPILAGLTGAGIGGTAGAALDDENRLRGAALGAIAGGGLGAAAGRGAEVLGRRGIAPVRRSLPDVRLTDDELEQVIGGVKATARGADLAATAAGDAARGSSYVNLAKFALDPAGEARLAEEAARVGREVLGDPKPVVTWDETRAMAARLGFFDLTRKQVNARLSGAEMLAIRNLIAGNMDELATVETRLATLRAEGGSPREIAEALSAQSAIVAQNAALLDRFIPARTNAGRDLNNLKILAHRSLDPVTWIRQAERMVGADWIARNSAEWETIRAKVQGYLARQDRRGLVQYLMTLRRAKPAEKVVTFWKANLLTNPVTHAVNTGWNMSFALLETTKDAPAAVGDWIMSLATGQRTLGGPSARQVVESARGARAGLREAAQVMRGVPLDEALVKYDIPREVNYDNAILDAYTKTVFRALGAADRVFRGAAFKGSLANQARVLARAEGHGGTALATRVQALLDRPTNEMIARAIADAEQATVTDMTGLGRMLSGIGGASLGNVPVGRFIVPFARTPGAVATRLGEYSPIGLTAGTVRLLRTLAMRGADPFQQREIAKLFGRGLTGTGIMALGYWLASKNLVTPSDLGDPAERQTRQQLGGETESAIRVGDTYFGIGRVSLVGNLLGVGATLYESTRDAANRSPADVAATLTAGAVGAVTDQPFLTGIRQAVEAARDPTGGMASRAAQSIASGFVPAAAGVAAVARGLDPTLRQTDNAGDYLRSRLPGASKALPPRYDQFGEERRRAGGFLGSVINPVWSSPDRTVNDPVRKEVLRVGAVVGMSGKRKDEMATDYSRRTREQGRAVRDAVERLIASPRYQALPDDDAKREAIEAAVSRARAKWTAAEKRATAPAGAGAR